MAIQIQFRRGTAAQWTAANPVLAIGEPGYETDTGKFKVGDGSTTWNSLIYGSGKDGNNATLVVDTANVVAPNISPTVVNQGTTSAANLKFSLPRAYTVVANSTTTLTAGSPATVTNSGNTTDIKLDFSIPAGANGSIGNTGNTGPISPKGVSILSPLAGDMITMFFTNTALTLAEVTSVLVGGSTPTANFHIAYGSSRSTGTNVFTSGCITGNTTYGQSNTSFNNSSVPANGFVWIIVNAVTGSPTELHATLRFTT